MRPLIVLVLSTMILGVGIAGSAAAQELGNALPEKTDVYPDYVNPGVRQGGDTIFDATVIPGIPYTDTGTTAGYNDDYDEVCPYSISTSPDVVYTFTPVGDVVVDIDLCGSGYDTKLYVYDAGLNLVACNDDFYFDDECGVYVSFLGDVPMSGGAPYFIIIDGYGGDFGDYILDITLSVSCDIVCLYSDDLEGEPPLVPDYEDMYNGGCNSIPPVFQHIPFSGRGRVDFCGVSGWYDYYGEDYRDTDWFIVEIGPSGYLEVWVDAEFEVALYELWPQDCDNVAVAQTAYGGPCDSSDILTIVGNPGDIAWLWVGPSYWEDYPAFMFEYRLIIEQPTSVFTLPNGFGNQFAAAYLYGGQSVSVVLPVDIGIPNVQPEYIWLETTLGGLHTCFEGAIADYPTGPDGVTTFEWAVEGGHYTDINAGERTRVIFDGEALDGHVHNIQFNSPDINGDLVVNLSDIAQFTMDLFGSYHYRCDYVWDGTINLSDVALMTTGIGAACPPAKRAVVSVECHDTIGIYFDRAGTVRSVNATANELMKAHLVVHGSVAELGLRGWECEIGASDNIEIVNWMLPEKTLNFAEPPSFIVGCGSPLAAADGESVCLMTIEFMVKDDQPAHFSIDANSLDSYSSGTPVCAVRSEGVELHPLGLPANTIGIPLATINGASIQAAPGLTIADLDLCCAPNPFNPATDIRFNLPREADVVVTIYNIAGQVVRKLEVGTMQAGANAVRWDGSDARGSGSASGLYFCRLHIDGAQMGPTLKMSLVR